MRRTRKLAIGPVLLGTLVGALLGTLLGACAGAPKPPPSGAVATVDAGTTAETPIQSPSPIEAWREHAPPPGPAPQLELPVFEKAMLPNGLEVLVSSERSLPIVSFAIVERGGSATDPAGQAGLTWLAFKLLGEGAGKRNAIDFANAVADLGASFDSAADQDSGLVVITGLTRNRRAMVDLLADAVLRPRLEKKDFERIKALALADLVRQRGSPEGLALQHVPALIYGPEHPYGHPPGGSEATVSKIGLDPVKKHLRASLSPGGAALIATGDISLAEAKALAEHAFGRWRGKHPASRPFPAVAPRKREVVSLIQKDHSPQTVVFIGRPLFGRGSPDEAGMVVTNAIYGGAFASRLNMNLREDKGYTYGAHSAVSLRRGTGAFYAYAAIRQDVTAPGLEQFFVELAALGQHPPSEEEVARAKDGIVRSLPGDFERTDAIASAAAQLFTYDLPLDWYAGAPARVNAVDTARVNAMVANYLTADTMQVLLVGDSGVIAKDVDKLKLGKLEIERPLVTALR